MKRDDFMQVTEEDVLSESPLEVSLGQKLSIELDEEDRQNLDFIRDEIDRQIRYDYAQAFAIESQLLSKVRIMYNGAWLQNADGSYVEDWGRLTLQDMESFILSASSATFFDTQKSIGAYAEGIFMKQLYEDEYDDAYSRILVGTIADKTAKAKRETQSRRWAAIYKSLYYKKSKEVVDKLDSHVRRMEKIYAERQKENERSFRASRERA